MKLLGKLVIAAAAVWASTTAFALTDPASARAGEAASALSGVDASADARYVEHWIRERGDDHGRPFAIVDKRAARIFVFGAGGQLVGSSSTILGLARGDVPIPGAGQKDPSQLLPYERRTPAGRFESQPGKNIHGEAVVWVDYETGIAIHRVRPGRAQAQRLHSLASDGADDKRLSLGCVVVPEAFFSAIILPTLGHSHGTIYVLPEDGPVTALFAEPRPATATAAATLPVRKVSATLSPAVVAESPRLLDTAKAVEAASISN